MASFTPPELRVTRRDALRGFASVGLLCALPKLTRSAPALKAAAKAVPFEADLQLPPTLVPVSMSGGEDRYKLTIREGRAEIIPGERTPVYGYDGIYPGPTIRARKGRKAVVEVTNGLPFEQNIHLHGGVTPAEFDGHPMQLIAPGESFTYQYPNEQEAASLWYHDHAHGLSARTMYYGLAGFYIVEDDLEAELDLPAGDFDLPLVIQDRSFNEDGSLAYSENIDEGFMGDTIVVNGAVSPRVTVKRALYRLRFLNASNARWYHLRIGNQASMVQIGGDAGLLEAPVERNPVPVAPAERVDVIVDFRKTAAGSRVDLTNVLGDADTAAVLRFDVSSKSANSGRIPKKMRPQEPIADPVASRRWELQFSTTGAPRWQISGREFDMDRIDARPTLNTTERWMFVNSSHRPHPMHLHGFHFRVLERSTGTVHPGDRAWKDTVMVETDETVIVQARFAPYPGRYVFHCHNMEHQEKAMMLQMEVA
ncbi:MAG TPA: multicopper oxidase domain-containing protein [Solirubrobacter sp.]|nr:multicopper oxidase domain-containing protein [Solirubrobacter sp.]